MGRLDLPEDFAKKPVGDVANVEDAIDIQDGGALGHIDERRDTHVDRQQGCEGGGKGGQGGWFG